MTIAIARRSCCLHRDYSLASEEACRAGYGPKMYMPSCRFTKSVIKSRAALTYAEAQTRIDDERLTDDVSAGLRELNRIAKILRRRRAERGALSLASPEVRFEIDTETHDPTDVGMYQVRSGALQMVMVSRAADVHCAAMTIPDWSKAPQR